MNITEMKFSTLPATATLLRNMTTLVAHFKLEGMTLLDPTRNFKLVFWAKYLNYRNLFDYRWTTFFDVTYRDVAGNPNLGKRLEISLSDLKDQALPFNNGRVRLSVFLLDADGGEPGVPADGEHSNVILSTTVILRTVPLPTHPKKDYTRKKATKKKATAKKKVAKKVAVKKAAKKVAVKKKAVTKKKVAKKVVKKAVKKIAVKKKAVKKAAVKKSTKKKVVTKKPVTKKKVAAKKPTPKKAAKKKTAKRK